MKITRSNLLFGSLFSLFVGIHAELPAQQIPPYLKQPSSYEMVLGDVKITALSDGSVNQVLKDLLINTTDEEIDHLTSENFQTDENEASVNAYLFKLDNKLMMVDAGTSDLYGPSLGFLPRNLLKAGYDPKQIDVILVTHIHTDHTGGLMDGNKIVFPNATVYVSKTELDFWLGEENYKKAPADKKVYFEQARERILPYVKAGKVKTFTFGKELFPGLTPLAAQGHTPGHTFYQLVSKNEKIVFWGDLLHSAAVQFPNPDVRIVYDIDPDQAAMTRKKAFTDAAQNKYWIAADHLSYPGIGHIKKEGNGYRWYPINYTIDPTGKGQ